MAVLDEHSDQGKAERSWITSDQPISSVAEDRLDRKRFSADLAQAISQWSSPHSLVIGLHAPWGEGKSSVKNLVLESLLSAGDNWGIVDFNPWQWTSHSQLSDAFFDEVAIALGKASRRKGRDLAASWRRYAAKLKGGSALAAALVRPLKMAMALAAILCGIGVFWPHRIYFAVACVCVSFLAGIVNTAHSSVPNKKGGSERRYIRIADVDTFADAEEIFNKIMRGETSPAFIAEHREVIRLFVAARDRKLAGKSDDYGSRADEEDD